MRIMTLLMILVFMFLLISCSTDTSTFTCDDMNSKFDCEGKTAGQCGKDPYVQWAKENCGLGTKEKDSL